jgi:hypothetical protein
MEVNAIEQLIRLHDFSLCNQLTASHALMLIRYELWSSDDLGWLAPMGCSDLLRLDHISQQ